MKLPLFSTSTVPSSKRRISGGGCSLGLVEACPLAPEDVASVVLVSIGRNRGRRRWTTRQLTDLIVKGHIRLHKNAAKNDAAWFLLRSASILSSMF